MKLKNTKSKITMMLLFFVAAAFTFTTSYFDDTPFIKQLINKQEQVNATYQTERVYVSTDKSHYVQGETVYLTGFIRNGNDIKVSDKSTVLHVEFLSPEGYTLQSKTYRGDTIIPGHIDIPQNITAGKYQIKAYTTWQRNDVHTKVFTKTIHVQEIDQTNHIATKPGTKAMIKFYPEGGDLINGLPGMVAFTVKDEYGRPIAFKGELKGTMGTSIKFMTNTDGMGKFSMIPFKGETYRLVNQGEKVLDVYGQLPAIMDEGYSMYVTHRSNDMVEFAIQTKKAIEGTITLKLRDELLYAKQHVLRVGENTISIPVKDFQQGVAQVTLFDDKDVEQAERLVYINKHKKLNISITPRKPSYIPNEYVSAQIKVTDHEGKPVKGNFTLSVLDKALSEKEANMGGNILSKLLLEPDLKGNIDNSAYYLSDEPGADDALDLLCMTRGWRRFEWKEVRAFEPSIMVHQFETNRVRGTLVDNKNRYPYQGKVVKLYMPAKDTVLKFTATTNIHGEFLFDNLPEFNEAIGMRLFVTINGVKHIYKLNYYASSLVANEYGVEDVNTTYRQGFTALTGKLMDEQTNQPIAGARVEIKRKYQYATKSVVTAADGSFSFSNINPGEYEIYLPVEGKTKPEKIYYVQSAYKDTDITLWRGEKNTTVSIENLESIDYKQQSLSVFEVKPTASVPVDFVEKGKNLPTEPVADDDEKKEKTYKLDTTFIAMIDQNKIGTGDETDQEDLWKLPTRNIEDQAARSSGVYKKPGGGISIRGSRTDGTVMIVDGVQVPYGMAIPISATGSMEVLTGGIPVMYGDFTGGAIMINTTGAGVVGFDPPADTLLMGTTYAKVRNFGGRMPDDYMHEEVLFNPFTEHRKTTIYWDGKVQTDAEGIAEVRFRNANFEGDFALVVEGASFDRLLGTGMSNFNSLDRMTLAISNYVLDSNQLKVTMSIKNNTDKVLSTSYTFLYHSDLNLMSPNPRNSFIKGMEIIDWDSSIYVMDKYIKNIVLEPGDEQEYEFTYRVDKQIDDVFFALQVANGNNTLIKTTLLTSIKPED